MNAISSAASGMADAVSLLNVSASNIAAADPVRIGSGAAQPTTGDAGVSARLAYAQLQLSSTPSDVDFTTETVNQIDAVTQFKANLSTVKVSEQMFSSLLNMTA